MNEDFQRQISNYDCVSKAFENALLAVFGEGFVPLHALRAIHRYSIDKKDGTSRTGIEKIFTKLSKMPEIYIRKLTGNQASPKGIFSALKMGHSVVVFVWCENNGLLYEHAVTAIATQGKHIHIFDPGLSHRTETLKSLRTGSNPMDKKIFLPITIGKSLIYSSKGK